MLGHATGRLKSTHLRRDSWVRGLPVTSPRNRSYGNIAVLPPAPITDHEPQKKKEGGSRSAIKENTSARHSTHILMHNHYNASPGTGFRGGTPAALALAMALAFGFMGLGPGGLALLARTSLAADLERGRPILGGLGSCWGPPP
jgi:hypothetical protein